MEWSELYTGDTAMHLIVRCSILLDTPCTARARSRLKMKILNLNIFRKKKFKKSSQNGPKYFSFANDIWTLTPFLQKVSKPVFQNPTVEKHVSTPHIRLAKVAENPDGRTNGRTDRQNTLFWLSDGRKERFAQKSKIRKILSSKSVRFEGYQSMHGLKKVRFRSKSHCTEDLKKVPISIPHCWEAFLI